jgi:hypothetical protein
MSLAANIQNLERDIAASKEQLDNKKRSLRTIEEHITEYPLETDVPPKLREEAQLCKDRIQELTQKIKQDEQRLRNLKFWQYLLKIIKSWLTYAITTLVVTVVVVSILANRNSRLTPNPIPNPIPEPPSDSSISTACEAGKIHVVFENVPPNSVTDWIPLTNVDVHDFTAMY